MGGAEGQDRAEETGLEPESGDGVRKIQRTKDADDEREMPAARDAWEDNGGDWGRDGDTGGEGNEGGGLTAEEQLEKEYQAAVDQGQVPSMEPAAAAGDGAEVAGADAGGAEEGGAAKIAADAGGEEQ